MKLSCKIQTKTGNKAKVKTVTGRKYCLCIDVLF